MQVIAVDKKGLLSDFRDWGVSNEYADFFVSKCDDNGETIAFRTFIFNDTIQLHDSIQWMAACAAFWCRAYREAKTNVAQVEALSAIRSLYFAAGFISASPVVAMLRSWWSGTYEIHQLPAPNQSQSQSVGFRSAILNTSFLHH
ncbi:hypothetical protein [Type-E symbiont of Plautia stali]|uniref:hypothetical protein n=1 Tax=Type-E symbiont of Plautia stali TaxID=1560357 RepID=UPI00073F44B9|nr:hypothetical protein [Type-E symbiont of Plautia stali]